MTQYRSWRHLLDFPRQGLKQNRKELDLADADKLAAQDELYPSLADITLEGVPAVRNLITDLAMDVLLYQSGYRGHIAGIVQKECNRIYKLFKQRNPSFKGSVSLCGHSLGSAVLFDILCHQPDNPKSKDHNISKNNRAAGLSQELGDLRLDFECENFFCLGSPLALFQMLRGRTIAGRPKSDTKPIQNPLTAENQKEAHLRSALGLDPSEIGDDGSFSSYNATVASPKCAQLFNIFHPSDPISYRIEPLISSAMASMKPQPLPYVKRSIWGASGQSLTNISARVGQSMGSLWYNFTSGVASSLLNRSLGLNDGTTTTVGTQAQAKDGQDPTSGEKKAVEDVKNATISRDEEQNLPTLLDQELETLYEGFQKRRASEQQDNSEDPLKTPEWIKADERARKLKSEEAKVRALNSNGRVDYSVQE